MNLPKHTAGTSYHNLLGNTRAELGIARAARNGARANWRSFIVSHLQTPAVSSKHSSQELLLPAEKAIDAGATFGPGATVQISVSLPPGRRPVLMSPRILYSYTMTRCILFFKLLSASDFYI
jgi:hypothetical protein